MAAIEVVLEEPTAFGEGIGGPPAEGPPVVIYLCPNCGDLLCLDRHGPPAACCAGVEPIRSDAKTVRLGPDGKAVQARRMEG